MIFPVPEPAEDQARYRDTPYYPMMVLNGLVQPKLDRQAPSSDYDETPVLFRRYINASGKQDVQIQNGLRNRIATGYRFNYPGAGWFAVPQAAIPGQMRGNYMQGKSAPNASTRGPTPFSFTDLLRYGPAAQSQHPGGVGQINAIQYVNPMTG